jgi:O-antigen/teichoic acid export membrane protein
MDTVRRVAKNTSFLILGNLTTKVLNLFLVVAIARYLGANGFGQYSLILAYVGLFGIVLNLGLDTLAERDIAQGKRKAGVIMGGVLLIKLFLFFFVLSLVSLSARLLSYPPEMITLFSLYTFSLFLTSQASLFRLTLHAVERMEYEFLFNFLNRSLVLLLSVGALLLGYGLPGLIYALLIASGVDLVFYAMTASRIVQRPVFRLDPPYWGDLVRKSLPFAMVGVFYGIYSNIDIVMVSHLKGDAAAGVYSAAFRMITALMFIPYAFSSSVFPLMARLSRDSRRGLERAYVSSFRYLSYLAIPIAIGTTLTADRIIVRFYGGGFEGSAQALQVLIWGGALMFLNSLLMNVLLSINREKINMKIAAAGVLLNVVLNLLLIPKYSYMGAGIATVAAELTFFVLCFYALHRCFLRISLLSAWVRPLAASSVMGLFLLGLREILTLFLLIPLAGGVYFGVLFLLRGFSEEDRAFFRRLREETAS